MTRSHTSYTPYSCAPHAACCCLAAQITASDACVNMVTVAESRRRSALVGTACQRVLLDSSGESHGCVHSCVDDHVDFEPHQVRLSTGEATRRKPAQRVSSVALTRSRERHRQRDAPPCGHQARRGGRFRIVRLRVRRDSQSSVALGLAALLSPTPTLLIGHIFFFFVIR